MSRRATAWLAWSLCMLGLALAAASPILALLNGRTLAEMFMAWRPSIAGLAALPTLTVSFSVVGALIASHRPENLIGWIFLAVGFFCGLVIAADEYAIYALLRNPGALPLGAEASWLAEWIWAPGFGLILVFLPLLFPDGHPPSPRWRPVAWLGGLSIGLTGVSSTILLWPERGTALVTGDESWTLLVRVLVEFIALDAMLFGAGLGAVISLFVRFRRAGGDERQQIKWFASAAALTLVWITVFGQYSPRVLPEVIVALSALLVIPSIPIATGIAILRYRLYDIDVIVNRTLVYGSLTATLALVYFGSIVVLQRTFVFLAGGGSHLTIVASTLAIAALFNPLRRRIQGFVDRRFYRQKYDARQTLEPFPIKLREETDLDGLSVELLAVARDTMRPEHASLWLRPTSDQETDE
jgi:hypothetical protein